MIPHIKMLVFVLVLVVKKLYHYFQAYAMQVITDQSLKQVFSRFNVLGWLLRWLVELGEFYRKILGRHYMRSGRTKRKI